MPCCQPTQEKLSKILLCMGMILSRKHTLSAFANILHPSAKFSLYFAGKFERRTQAERGIYKGAAI
ncbi:hypothetical protein BD779DRAFT_1529881 [Infundibulicybe gibba]|nr:hypothetical protein BD779DRAFT_1529881 [Infundibulicybe gibba]